MASFAGHIDEGVVFVILALWWLYNMSRNYFRYRQEGKPYRTEMSYPATIRGREVPLEIGLKILFPICGFTAECFANQLQFVDREGHFRNHNGMQHMTIYFIFFVHGITDLIDYLRLTSMRDLNYMTAGLAFTIYGMGFYFHSDPSTGKPPLERIVHRIPISLMFLTALMGFVEIFKRDSVVIQIIRCHTVLTFGTWFSYISFILFDASEPLSGKVNPAWDQHDESSVHFMATAFGIHLIINMIIVILSFYIAESSGKCLRFIPGLKDRYNVKYERTPLLDEDDSNFGDNEL